MKRIKKMLKIVGIALAASLLVVSSVAFIAARRSIFPDNINMSTSGMDGMEMSGMNMPTVGTPSPNATPMSALVEHDTDAPTKSFTLTAQTATINLGNSKTINAYTFNGTVPGPELRVQQGDLVVVTVINKLPESTTVHWHGIEVPNAEDGVAGVTQDAIQPGASYTYRFVAKDVGTYWYHSHQNTALQLPLGLFGAIIVEPKEPTVHYDRDYMVFLHEWGAALGCRETCPETLSINDQIGKILLDAKPGEKIRLRIGNTGDDVHTPILIGASFQVIALDGHDLNGPTPLTNVALPMGTAQRYDISFVMPTSGTVALIDLDSRAEPTGQHPMAVFGNGPVTVQYPANAPKFDPTTYGAPAPDTITLNTHFDAQYDLNMTQFPGFFNGKFTMRFTINGASYPRVDAIQVKPGDIVKLHMTAEGIIPFPHAMHLHGHVFTVLAHNGKPLSGSPVHLDTILVNPGESWDVAFVADNPGLWMLHCHILAHDKNGMDMMVEYPDIYTPYTIGKSSGNNPF